MQITHKIIGIFSMLILVLCLWALPKLEKTTEKSNLIDLIGFDVEGCEAAYRVKLFEGEDGEFYVFLPSYAFFDKIRLSVNGNIEVIFNGSIIKNGEYLNVAWIGEDTHMMLTDKKEGEFIEGKINFYVSKNLPAIYLSTKSGSMDYIDSDKRNKESGYIIITSEEGKELYSDKIDKISGRGNTSWEVPKKSYSIELHSRASLLGMSEAKKWILTANYYDGTFIRNKIGFQLAQEAGLNNTPDSRFVDLYVNGRYWGLYQLTERIEVDKNRINIGSGFLMEVDYPERAVYENNIMYLENGQPIVIHNPKKVTKSQILFLQSWYQDMFLALYSENYFNPVNGKYIFDYLDKESFARMYLVEEILEDLDFGVTSHYMYKGENNESLLFDGPVWDLDNTMGRGYYKRNEFFAIDQSLSSNQISRWYARLCGNDEFQQTVLTEWKERVGPALEHISNREIDDLVNKLEASITMDIKRWPGPRSRFMPQADLYTNVEFLKNYMLERYEFLDCSFSENWKNTSMFMENKAEGLPALEQIEKYQLPDENTEKQKDTQEGHNFLGNHGIVLFLVMFLGGCILIFVDRKRKW